MKLSEACTSDEVIKVLALRAWYTTHNGEDCPAEYIPGEDDLCDWITYCDEQIQTQASEHLNSLFSPPKSGSWHWWRIFSKQDPSLKIFAALCYIEYQENGKKRYELALHWNEQGQTIGPAAYSLEQVHDAWKAIPQNRRPPHPLAPLVEAWQAEPTPVDPFRPQIRAVLPNFKKTDNNARFLLKARQPVPVSTGEQMLLDLPELTPQGCASWLLRLFDRAGGQSMRQGRGAPWDMRLFIGAMLHLPIAKRDNQWHNLRLPTEEVVSWLHPNGWTNRARDWSSFPEALFCMNKELGVVEIEGLGYVQIIGATVIPKMPNDPMVEFIVRIPKTAAHGARLDWPRLCKYGLTSAVLYRAYLASMEFMHLSAHKGQPITQVIGKPLIGSDGKPLRRKGGQVKRSETETIPNPATRYVRGLTEGELTAMIGLNPRERYHRQRTRAAFDTLHKDGVINLKKEGHGRRTVWRIFGPATNSS